MVKPEDSIKKLEKDVKSLQQHINSQNLRIGVLEKVSSRLKETCRVQTGQIASLQHQNSQIISMLQRHR
jgi:hypothetical protein